MDIVSILSRVAGGFTVKAGACAGALYGVSYVWSHVSAVFSGVSHVL